MRLSKKISKHSWRCSVNNKKKNAPIRKKWRELFFVYRISSEKGWGLYDRSSKELIGTYESKQYALKQGEYRYRKMLIRVDRLLLGQTTCDQLDPNGTVVGERPGS